MLSHHRERGETHEGHQGECKSPLRNRGLIEISVPDPIHRQRAWAIRLMISGWGGITGRLLCRRAAPRRALDFRLGASYSYLNILGWWKKFG